MIWGGRDNQAPRVQGDLVTTKSEAAPTSIGRSCNVPAEGEPGLVDRVVPYIGPSMFPGQGDSLVRVVAYEMLAGSTNSKTGPVAQVGYLNHLIRPNIAGSVSAR